MYTHTQRLSELGRAKNKNNISVCVFPQGSVFCLALSRRLAVSGSFDHSVCVWDRLSPAPAPYALVRKMAGLHADMVYGVAVNAAGVVLRWGKS